MYKTILIYLASAKSAAFLSEAAGYIAEKCNAHVIGAHNSAKIALYGGIPSDYLAQHNQAQREEADAIQQSFSQVMQSRNVSHEWRHKVLRDTEAFGDIVSAARTADLIVAGGKGEDDPLGNWYDLPIRLILESGRPVLLLPGDKTFDTIGERITLAWNHSHESARAAFDGLPFLKMADSVRVLSINSTEDGASNPSQDMADTLSRHGVNAQAAVSNSTEHSDEEQLILELKHSQSDLLVMGCYGHSRLREMLLGGATKYVLNHMPIPVLMSH